MICIHSAYRKDASKLKAELEKELESIKEEVEENDWNIYRYFAQKDGIYSTSNRFHSDYELTLELQATAQSALDHNEKVQTQLQPLFTMPMTIDQVNAICRKLKDFDGFGKKAVEELIAQENQTGFFSDEERTIMRSYIESNEQYFLSSKLNEPALECMSKALGFYCYYHVHKFRLQKRKLLELMLELEGL